MQTYKRKVKRHNARYAVSFKVADSNKDELISGLTLDLNKLGLSLFSPKALVTGSKLKLWILDPATRRLVRAKGRVAWIQVEDTYADSPYWVRAGICFEGMGAKEKKQLTEVLPEVEPDDPSDLARKHIMAVHP